MKNQMQLDLEHGARFPFDESDDWWNDNYKKNPPSKAKDWTYYAARGIIADLQDRRGIKNEFTREIDEDIRKEIIQKIADIIKEAYKTTNEQLNLTQSAAPDSIS